MSIDLSRYSEAELVALNHRIVEQSKKSSGEERREPERRGMADESHVIDLAERREQGRGKA
jgi:hypothetical protein